MAMPISLTALPMNSFSLSGLIATALSPLSFGTKVMQEMENTHQRGLLKS